MLIDSHEFLVPASVYDEAVVGGKQELRENAFRGETG